MTRDNLGRTIVVASAVAFLAGLVPGCSSDNNDNMQTTPCVALQGTTTPAPGTVVAQDGNSGDCGVLTVNLVVTDDADPNGTIDDLFGANLVVTFPDSLLSFTSASELGSILASGSAVSVQATVSNPGEITVGITRLNSTGVNVQGGVQLLRLTFLRTGSQGSGSLGVSGDLLDSSTPPAAIPNITFYGATVVVFQQ